MIRVYTKLAFDRGSAFIADPVVGLPRTSKLRDFDFVPVPGMLYVTARAISSRVNANYDGWPPEELRRAYRSFEGRPVFVDHHNWDESRSRGVILQSRLIEDRLASGHDDVWIELLIEVDAHAFPKLARAILDGDVDAVSMGADVEFTVCSACGNKASDVSQYCEHIPGRKGQRVLVPDRLSGRKTAVLVYEDCYGVGFFEISFVFDPADESALITDKMLVPGRSSSSSWTSARIRREGEGDDDYRLRQQTLTKRSSVQESKMFQTSTGNSATTATNIVRATLTTNATSSSCPDCSGRGAIRTKVGNLALCSRCGGRGVTADEVLMSLPEDVDTLRAEIPCPICGAETDGVRCQNCGWEQPPPGLRDPDEEAPTGIDPALVEAAPDEADEQEDESEEDEEAQPQAAEEDEDDEQDDDEEQDDEDDEEDRDGRKRKGGRMTRIDELRQASKRTAEGSPFGTHDVGTVYDQVETAPANAVTPYGTSSPVGQPVPPAEPPVVTQGEEMQEPRDDVQNLDASIVDGPQGQSAVNVAAKDRRVLRAQRLEAEAARLRREAEQVIRDDVQNLDAPAPVDVQPDAVVDVTRPTAEPNQLALADTPDMINDGREVGIGLPVERVPGSGQFNEFQDAAYRPYQGSVEEQIRQARRDAGARVIRISNLIDQRIELGLVPADAKMAEIGRFEGMSDERIEGWIDATEEIRQARVRVAGRRIRMTARAGHPEMGATPSSPIAAGQTEDAAMDAVYLLSN